MNCMRRIVEMKEERSSRVMYWMSGGGWWGCVDVKSCKLFCREFIMKNVVMMMMMMIWKVRRKLKFSEWVRCVCWWWDELVVWVSRFDMIWNEMEIDWIMVMVGVIVFLLFYVVFFFFFCIVVRVFLSCCDCVRWRGLI